MPTGDARPIVVLADDDEDARTLLARAVRRKGFKVCEASSGESLLACIGSLRARGQRVSLVLSDINMPDPDGIEATEKLHQLDSSLRVVLNGFRHRFRDPQRASGGRGAGGAQAARHWHRSRTATRLALRGWPAEPRARRPGILPRATESRAGYRAAPVAGCTVSL